MSSERSFGRQRKLSQQQRRRIQQQQAAANLSTDLHTGLITSNFGRQVEVETENGQRQRCYVRANLQGLVTGDRVSFRLAQNPEEPGVIEACQPRSSLLARPDMRGQMRPIAANVDQIILVIAPEPEPQANLIDRYLVAAAHTDLPCVLLLNKTDLLPSLKSENQQAISCLQQTYTSLGYACIQASSQEKTGLSQLEAVLTHKTSVLVGQSGVGKSSLVNALVPEAELAVGELSLAERKGRHTTTNSRLLHLNSGGWLIDSPGISEFALGYLTPVEISQGFIEMRQFLGACRFRDCRHQQDPGCALVAAVAEGKLLPQRLASMQKLMLGQD